MHISGAVVTLSGRTAALPILLALVGAGVAAAQTPAQPASSSLYSAMRWREIGPMRAGRTRALAGVASEPSTFYIGAVGGGVFKTTDAGETWHSLWDHEPTGSIGAIAVAPSDPRIIYVGSGEGLARPDLSTGDGVYKSTDAGKSWTHLGLRDSQQIGQVAVDPTNPNIVFVAAEGHPYGPNEERGLYKSTDGGATFKRVLFVNDRTGASEVQIDPQHPNIVFAGMWQRQEGPWENGSWEGPDGGLFRSTDGGETWTKLTGGGLPDGITQVNLTISPTDSKRIYLEAATGRKVGLYRSDDGGSTWVHAPVDDTRPEERIGGGDLPVPVVDPKDPDTIYVASVVTWKSTDAGKTWTGFRGSPGGDDYQGVYINPNNTKIVALTSDQGAIITVNGGHTWSQWYNQPTAQVYHVTADNAFPYRVCSGQQDSGSACVASRSDDGRITFHDWHPVGIEEYGYAAPDPLDPDIVYGGKVTRYDRRTGQVQDVPPSALHAYRALRTEPLQFSPIDPHNLYFATNFLWLTRDGGKNWKQISPDLSRETFALPAVLNAYDKEKSAQPIRRGVIYALGLSPLNIDRIWAGTDDGFIWTTTDGGAHWSNVTPPELKPFWKVFNMDAGHFDTQTAYAAINTLRLDDMRPHLFRTHDGGKTWTEIDNGIPDGAATSTIREDPKQKGLLYAGTETQVYVSFDDGDHWQSLRLNMPATSVRDLTIKGDDLIAGTHGRGFLDPGRRHAAAPDRRACAGRQSCNARRSECSPLCPPDDDPRAQRHESAHALAARHGHRREPSRWRHHRLLPRSQHQRPRHAADPRQPWRGRHRVQEHGPGASTRSALSGSNALGARAACPLRRTWRPSLPLGHALPAKSPACPPAPTPTLPFRMTRPPSLRRPGSCRVPTPCASWPAASRSSSNSRS